MEARVVSNDAVAEDIFSLVLDLGKSLQAKPGQFVLVSAKDYPQRAYSIVREVDSRITLGIKKQKEMSVYLSTLKKGDFLEVLGPFGSFIPRDAQKVTLIGGGIGITPLVSLYNYYKEQDIPVKVLFSSRNSFPFVEHFGSPQLFDTTKGRRVCANDVLKDSLVYICGPTGMIEDLRSNLINQGHSEDAIYSEDFS